jgi:hypothetical protein
MNAASGRPIARRARDWLACLGWAWCVATVIPLLGIAP